MVALLFAATSSFVSCKDNIDDDISPIYNALAQRSAELQQKIDSLKQVIDSQQPIINNYNTYIDTTINNYFNEYNTYIDTTVIIKINDCDSMLKIINKQITNQALAIDSINAKLNLIDSRINGLSDSVRILWGKVDLILQKLEELINGNFITSVTIDGTRNDVLGVVALPGIEIPALAAYYGTNDNTIDKFPYAGYDFNVGGKEFACYLEKDELPFKGFVTFDGDLITEGYGNAGQVYFTINSTDYETLDISRFTKVTVENSAGEVSPVKLENFRKSSARITWGLGKRFFTETGNKSDNGFYVADATIYEKDLNATRFGIEKFIDLKQLRKDLKARLDDIRDVEGENGSTSNTSKFKNFVREAAGLVFGLFQNDLTEKDYKTNASYSKQRLAFFTEKDGKLVRKGQTDLKLFTTAIKPLSYNTFWEYEKSKDGNWIIEECLEKALSKIAKAIHNRLGGKYGISVKIVSIDESSKTVTIQFNGQKETIKVDDTQYWSDLKKAINSNGGLDAVNAKLAKLLSPYTLGNATEAAVLRINTYLDKASDKLSEWISKHLFTRAIAPIIIFETTTGMDRLCEGMMINKGTMHAYLTSGTMELLAPAYKKYVALKKGGTLLQSEVLPGNTQTYDFDLTEKGDYTIILSCVDYFGYVITKKYDIHVN
jgi:hypothetical protein